MKENAKSEEAGKAKQSRQRSRAGEDELRSSVVYIRHSRRRATHRLHRRQGQSVATAARTTRDDRPSSRRHTISPPHHSSRVTAPPCRQVGLIRGVKVHGATVHGCMGTWVHACRKATCRLLSSRRQCMMYNTWPTSHSTRQPATGRAITPSASP